jgi:hypothetical protein
LQLASNDRSGLEGTPIDMAPELFDRQRAPERGHRRARARARLVEPYTEIALPWDIANTVVAGKRPEWRAERCVPDWFAALVRRMWTPDAAARSAVQDVGARRATMQMRGSDSDDRCSVDEIVRKLSLRDRHATRKG